MSRGSSQISTALQSPGQAGASTQRHRDAEEEKIFAKQGAFQDFQYRFWDALSAFDSIICVKSAFKKC
jgi:hypothetical protein